MPRKIAILLLVVFIGGLLFPFLALAGQYESNKGTVIYKGLVPCGKTEALEGEESSLVTEPCQLCHIFVMIDGIIDFVTQKIVPPIVVLMIIIAGIMFFFAGGNPTLLLQAKKLITSVVIGLVIMFSAFLIIQTILNVVGVADTNPLYDWLKGNSFTIYCSVEYEEGVTPGEGVTPEGQIPFTPEGVGLDLEEIAERKEEIEEKYPDLEGEWVKDCILGCIIEEECTEETATADCSITGKTFKDGFCMAKSPTEEIDCGYELTLGKHCCFKAVQDTSGNYIEPKGCAFSYCVVEE